MANPLKKNKIPSWVDKETRYSFIEEYLRRNGTVFIDDEDFHKEYHEAFSYYQATTDGAGEIKCVRKAKLDLKDMHEEGLLLCTEQIRSEGESSRGTRRHIPQYQLANRACDFKVHSMPVPNSLLRANK